MLNKNAVAKTPPMGWNSWDCFGAGVNEEQLMANAEYMRDNLKEYGWEYVVCDIQWSEPTAHSCNYHNFAELYMDEYSRLIPAPERFPSSAGGKGFSVIAQKVHDMGLKFGIHIMRGIPRQAVHRNTPIKCEGVTARDIAQQFSVCNWNTDMYGIKANVKGAQEYYDSIFELYASWGVDFIKVDDICITEGHPNNLYSGKAEIEMIRKALDKCGRDMVLSLSPGPAQIEHGYHLSANANMWRLTGDFWDQREKVREMFRKCEMWYKFTSEGCWPDCDMLPFGHLRVGDARDDSYTRFSKEDQYTVMNLWSIFRSPLIFGGHMPDNDEFTLSLLTNQDIIDINQHSSGNRPVVSEKDKAVWTCFDKNGNRVVAFFNITDDDMEFTMPSEIAENENITLTNLWTKEKITATAEKFSITLAANDSAIFRIEKA